MKPFSEFGDAQGYGGFVPSSSWLCMMYDHFIEDHGEQIDQRCAMCSADICAIDHSHKVCGTMQLTSEKWNKAVRGLASSLTSKQQAGQG
jgi:hypothetical protein